MQGPIRLAAATIGATVSAATEIILMIMVTVEEIGIVREQTDQIETGAVVWSARAMELWGIIFSSIDKCDDLLLKEPDLRFAPETSRVDTSRPQPFRSECDTQID